MVPAGALCDVRAVGDGDDERRSGPPSLGNPLSARATIPPPTPRVTQAPPTPRPMAPAAPRTTLPPPPSSQRDGAMRGALNVVRRCLRVVPGERVHLVTYRAGPLYEPLCARGRGRRRRSRARRRRRHRRRGPGCARHRGAARAPARGRHGHDPDRAGAALGGPLGRGGPDGGGAEGAAPPLSPEVDERVLAQSLRADPELLATVNTRLAAALQPPCQIRVTSDAGTEIEVRLAMGYPILSSNGRPAPGASENLPAGLVYTHQARITGTLVVDRAIFGPGLAVDRGALRRAPARVRFNGTRVADFEAPDPAVARAIEAYLASHADAGRVGDAGVPHQLPGAIRRGHRPARHAAPQHERLARLLQRRHHARDLRGPRADGAPWAAGRPSRWGTGSSSTPVGSTRRWWRGSIPFR